jgi:regulation of enolase protein 1 (concanavalin A-like superfamily)
LLFFIKPRLTLSLLVVNRETFNHIEQRSIKNAFVLEARVRNEGRALADIARITLKIDNVTADFELHAWQALGQAVVADPYSDCGFGLSNSTGAIQVMAHREYGQWLPTTAYNVMS